MRTDLRLDYAHVGLLLAVPALLAGGLEPMFGLLADTGRRRALVVGGGMLFAGSLLATGLAPGFAGLLAAFIVFYPASGAFVALSQASLMDLDPRRHEVNMARWTLAGSVGVVAGPLLLGLAVVAGAGWRGLFIGLAVLALPLVAAAARAPALPAAHQSLAAAARDALGALRRREVLRWLAVLEATDLMGDVLLGYLALYLVDVVRLPVAGAGALVVAWTAAGLAGDALLLVVLRRVSGLAYLRASALAALVAFPAFLLVPSPAGKAALLVLLALLHAGWYAVPQGRLFTELGDRSGTAVAISSLATAAGSLLPLGVGMLAERAGLQVALWSALLAPIALLLLARPRPGGAPERVSPG